MHWFKPTHFNQFRSKSKYATNRCINIITEILFDYKLLSKTLNVGVPGYTVRVIAFWPWIASYIMFGKNHHYLIVLMLANAVEEWGVFLMFCLNFYLNNLMLQPNRVLVCCYCLDLIDGHFVWSMAFPLSSSAQAAPNLYIWRTIHTVVLIMNL